VAPFNVAYSPAAHVIEVQILADKPFDYEPTAHSVQPRVSDEEPYNVD